MDTFLEMSFLYRSHKYEFLYFFLNEGVTIKVLHADNKSKSRYDFIMQLIVAECEGNTWANSDINV